MQFGFMPGWGTMEAIFTVWQLKEKYLRNNKQLYFIFVDLEKAFDRVPQKVVQWAMRKLLVEDWLVKVVMVKYDGPKTSVSVNGVQSGDFEVKVGVHQGSVLSLILFIVVLGAISQEFRGGSPWELMYANDLVLIADSVEEIMGKYTVWKEGGGQRTESEYRENKSTG